MKSERWFLRAPAVALAIAAVLFTAAALLWLVSLRSVAGDAAWVDHTHQVLEALGGTLQSATAARQEALRFALSGETQRLSIVGKEVVRERASADRVAELTADNVLQRERAATLQKVARADENWFRALVRSGDSARARAAVQSLSVHRRDEQLRRLIEEMEGEERQLLQQRARRQRVSVRRTMMSGIAGDLLILALVTAAVMMSRRALQERSSAEQQLASANDELTRRLSDLQQRTSELALLGTLAENLQTCEGKSDVDRVVDDLLPRLFPNSRGVVFLVKRSTEIVPQTSWPPELNSESEAFQWQECLGMSRFTMYRSGHSDSPVCPHVRLGAGQSAICVPMLARGEPVGLLHFLWSDQELRVEELVRTVAEQLALAYANLSLHETLRRQAVRDPLTGVFNRRYMEESLEREIHRAARHDKPLAVLLVDLDRFKEFNDALGHAAGDELLLEVAKLMERMVRGEDIVCRYGGDEFVIIMPDAEARVVAARAQSLMDQVMAGPVASGSPVAVTLSIGVAMFPRDGVDARGLLKSADGALYEAKRSGRGRVLHA